MKFTIRMFVGALVLGLTQAATADFALTNLGPERGGGTPAADSAHGWQFLANESITVTHLGLFDLDGDGFDISHPIGLFDLASMDLLTSGTMSAGVGDPLIDEFRYIDTPDVTLEAGRTYVISYYSATSNDDWVITNATFDVNSAITYVQGRWGDANALEIPANATGDTRIGPNFQFIPAPAAALPLLAAGGLLVSRRRRR